MSIKYVFKNTIPSCSFIFKNGKQAAFIAGKYLTDIESEIKEFMAEIAAKHPYIFIDQNEVTVDTDALSPLDQIKKQAVDDYLAAQTAALNTTNDRGTSNSSGGEGTGIASTANIPDASGNVAAITVPTIPVVSSKLAALKVPPVDSTSN